MDPVMIEKLHAMKRYRSSKRSFVHSFMKCAFSIFFFGVFLSCPLWFPEVFYSCRAIHFVFVFIPNIKSFIMSTKCLFVLCNIIVIVLVGESKRLGGGVPVADIYEEYARRNKRSVVRAKKVTHESSTYMEKEMEEEEEEEMEEGCSCVDGVGGEEEDEMEVGSCGDDGGGEEEGEMGLKTEELNRRAEDFIAMMNNQFKEEWR